MPKILEFSQAKNKNGKKVKSFVLAILTEFNFPYKPQFDYDLDHLEAVYRKPANNFWLLMENKEILGTIAIVKQNKKTAQLKRFYLKRKLRGKGWGKRLFKKALQFCQKKGYQTLVVGTTRRNHRAIDFFQKAGFKLEKQENLSYYFSKELVA